MFFSNHQHTTRRPGGTIVLLLVTIPIAWFTIQQAMTFTADINLTAQQSDTQPALLYASSSQSISSSDIGEPAHLSIPRIGVASVIEHTGLTKGGLMAVPADYQTAGWYKHGFRPGQNGNAIIQGHVDTRTFAPGIFRDLKKLTPGDTIEVTDAHGKLLKFRVTDSKVVTYDAKLPELFSQKDVPTLTLITCTGTWEQSRKDYDRRLIVVAELTES